MALIDFDKIKDIFGLSAPLTKLIEVISQGTGAISSSYLIKKNADAKAYEIKVISKAISENQDTLKKIDYKESKVSLKSLNKETIREITPLPKRTENRILHQEHKRQQNIESITQIAVEQLEKEESVSDEKVDGDWITRFFNYAKDVTNDEMQKLWGRILAGEVKSPNSYSIRTLNLIRDLSKSEADTFTKLANYMIRTYDDVFIYKGKHHLMRENFGVTFDEISLMRELGIIHGTEFATREYRSEKEPSSSYLIYGDLYVLILSETNAPGFRIYTYPLTTIGKELLKLIDIKPNFEYIKEIAKELQTVDTVFEYAKIDKVLDEEIVLSTELKRVLE